MGNKKLLIFLHESSEYGANLSILNLCKQLANQTDINIVLPIEGPICNSLKDHHINYKVISIFKKDFWKVFLESKDETKTEDEVVEPKKTPIKLKLITIILL